MALPKSIQDKDPFAKAVPGYSLTQQPGKWPWERPPQFVDPDDAIEFILDRVEDPVAQERYTKLMVAGISIEEIVNSIAIAGFQEGAYTPDIAELIKMPLAIYFMNMAEEKEIMVNVFATPDGAPAGLNDDSGLDEDTMLEIMAKRNPKVFNEAIKRYRPDYSEEEEETGMVEMAEEVMEAKTAGGFLAVEEGDIS